jgi:hypothetical protein
VETPLSHVLSRQSMRFSSPAILNAPRPCTTLWTTRNNQHPTATTVVTVQPTVVYGSRQGQHVYLFSKKTDSGTRPASFRDKAAGIWNWPLTSIGMSGDIPPLHLYVFMTCIRETILYSLLGTHTGGKDTAFGGATVTDGRTDSICRLLEKRS